MVISYSYLKGFAYMVCKHVIDYILPLRCPSCQTFSSTNDGFCGDCWGKINFISKPYCKSCGCGLGLSILDGMICGKCFRNSPNYELSRSLMKFNEHSKRIIHAFKYHDRTGLGKIFAKLLCHKYEAEINDIDIVVFVPMHKLKRLFRMYNQAQLLAHEMALMLKKPLGNNMLIKSKWTKSQASLSKIEREKNLRDSIKFNSKYKIKGKKILLVDDVMTTGTTINKCTKLLKQAGASSVYVVTIAMT
jgi:ComF family protein